LEDLGSIVQIGYSAGAQSKPFFDWVQNVKSKTTNTFDLDKRTSSAFAFFWNLCHAWLPKEIIADIDNWLTKTSAPAMDATHQLHSHEGSYDLIVDGIPFKFTDVCLAPPSGVMARNYARQVLLLVLPLCHYTNIVGLSIVSSSPTSIRSHGPHHETKVRSMVVLSILHSMAFRLLLLPTLLLPGRIAMLMVQVFRK
jgi:hypothetical protein